MSRHEASESEDNDEFPDGLVHDFYYKKLAITNL